MEKIQIILTIMISFFVVRIFFLKTKNNRGKNIKSIFFTGFFGYFIVMPMSIYYIKYPIYLYTALSYLLLAIIGLIGCFVVKINPFKKVTEEQVKRVKKEFNNNDYDEDYKVQSIKESFSEIRNILKKAKGESEWYENFEVKGEGVSVEAPFLLLTRKALYHIYPCNWVGDVIFKHGVMERENETEKDTENYMNKMMDIEKILREKVDKAKGTNIPIRPIVCVTNNAKINLNKPNYEVIKTDEMIELIEKQAGKELEQSEFYQIRREIKM